jgi:hypothetical protein
LIIGLSNKSKDITGPSVALSLSPYGIEGTKRRSSLLQEDHESPQAWRDMMKALIAALALVTLIASPTFARPAARASTQSEFVFPTDQQRCQAGQTDFCHWRGYPLWQWYSGS